MKIEDLTDEELEIIKLAAELIEDEEAKESIKTKIDFYQLMKEIDETE